MRMIDFRVWDKKKSEILDVMDIDFSGKKIGVCNVPKRMFKDGRLHTIHSIERDWSEVELMQSTGLKDKNDTEIFEGDIVKRTYLFNGGLGETHTGEVVYDKDYARYVISRPQKYIEPKTEDLRNTLSDRSTYEIIGNIYENRELLEEI